MAALMLQLMRCGLLFGLARAVQRHTSISAWIYERRDMLAEAKHEMLASLRLDPEQLDAGNRLTCDQKERRLIARNDCSEHGEIF